MTTPTEIADKIIPEYRALNSTHSCTGRVAERWSIAYEAAELALKSVTASDGWIEHHGRDKPELPSDTKVHVRVGGEEIEGYTVGFWHSRGGASSNWVHEGDTGVDITHYRAVPQ